MEAGGSYIQGHLWLHSEFLASTRLPKTSKQFSYPNLCLFCILLNFLTTSQSSLSCWEEIQTIQTTFVVSVLGKGPHYSCWSWLGAHGDLPWVLEAQAWDYIQHVCLPCPQRHMLGTEPKDLSLLCQVLYPYILTPLRQILETLRQWDQGLPITTWLSLEVAPLRPAGSHE